MDTIAIVEDDAAIRDTLATMFNLNGYNTMVAADGQEGLERIRETPPDLVVCDIMMPRLDGIAMYKELRTDPRTAAIPFIFLSARSDRHDVRLGMGIGADDYITKPFDNLDLVKAVETRLRKQRENVQNVHRLQHSIASSIPHAFRNPLTGIIGFSTLLLDELREGTMPDTESMIENLSYIREAGETIFRIIQRYEQFIDLRLAATNQETRQMENRSRVYANWHGELRQRAMELAESWKRAADLDVQLAATPPLAIKESELHLALKELLDNAFRFSENGNAVTLTGKIEANDTYRFSICDTGEGFNEERLGQVVAFSQATVSSHSTTGTGLGLPLAFQVASLCEGHLTFRNREGGGTQADLTIPIATGRT